MPASQTPNPEPTAAAQASGRARRARVSLKLRVLTLVAAINIVVFAAGMLYVADKIAEQRAKDHAKFTERILYTLESSISSDGELRVAQILSWPNWDTFTDAVISDLKPYGVSLNPVGSFKRGVDFDREGIDWGMRRAVSEKKSVQVAGGRAMRIVDEQDRPWGAVWFRVEEASDVAPGWRGLLPWFFLSTLLLFLGTFTVLRRYVLKPVGTLASAAQRMRAGDLGVHVELPRHRDELADLMSAFNHMSAEVKDFHDHLELEMDDAKRKAFEAEAAALRQRRLAAMGELAAGIAHEINNPLGGMLNAIDVLDRDDLPAQKRTRYVQLVRGGLERIQGTVAGLLRFTPRAAERASVDLAVPVSDAIALMQHSASKSGVEISFDDRSANALVLGSASELGQAVLNLISNALHAIQDRQRSSGDPERGGQIEVGLLSERGELRLSVMDDGSGVPEDQLERMTDLFYTTKEVGRGTGLGLALVLSVVNQHAGHVHLANREGGGFRVEIVLPLATNGESGA